MSQSDIERVIGRAATDENFRNELLANVRVACKNYNLTNEELEALEQLDAQGLVAFAGTLDKRISKTAGMGFV